MRPAARIAAFCDLVDALEDSLEQGGFPADVLVNKFFRARRYAGSKDRKFVSGLFYRYIRNRELLTWVLQQVQAAVHARSLSIAFIAQYEPEFLPVFLEEDKYGPEIFSSYEQELAGAIGHITLKEAPALIQNNVPEWAQEAINRRFGEGAFAEAEALNNPAALDVRLNPVMGQKNVINNIKKIIDHVDKSKYSPLGYRIHSSVNMPSVPAYSSGQIEIQDEAAQIASLLVDSKTGMKVADMCAGAGGKSLAVASLMANKGQVHAFDIVKNKLDECAKRAKRGGHTIITQHHLPEDTTSREASLKPFEGQCDRVIVDAPCTGTGTWRRSPDQRWRNTKETLKEKVELQFSLLGEASRLVKPDGRLLYMTCSVMPEENEDVVTRFLEQHKGWKLLNYKDIWKGVNPHEALHSASLMEGTLQLTPYQHGTDGFFVAILQKCE